MTPFGQAATPFDQRVEAAIRAAGWQDEAAGYALAAAPVASPVHRGVASDCVRVDMRSGARIFLKIRHEDMDTDVSPFAADAACKAAELGVGPEVALATTGLLGLAYLPEPWRYGRVGDLQDPAILGMVLAAKRRLHGAEPLGHRFDPFERIAALARQARAAAAPLPDGVERLVAASRLIRDAIAASGIDIRFCHNDGVASNVMLRAGEVRLVDFDLAGDGDPWFDVGAIINEACAFDADRRAALELYAGRCDETLFNRCRLYGAVDDLMWGLWGVTRAVTSRRPGVEFYKYGTWRLHHASAAFASPEFETWLRRL